MSYQRFPNALRVSSKILGDSLKFPSGKEASNRFLKAALTELLSSYNPSIPTKHGLPSSSILNIYDKWGNGGFGMILTSNILVDPTNLESAGNAIIFKEGDCEERRDLFKKWAKNMKQDGALAILQLSHAGRQTPITINEQPWGASNIKLDKTPRYVSYGTPIELTTEQVKTEVIDRFTYAAKFAYECGFDGVQLHAAHGYLLSQFTSPTTNKRTDKYGGSLENRQRVIVETFDAIRNEIPTSANFLIGLKTNSVEFQSEGTTVEDAIEMCTVYENKGFDFVELSGGTYEALAFYNRDSTKKREAFFLEFAEKIRPVFKNTVVYLTGGFRTVGAMVEAIETNATQGIGLGRPITAEPDLPKKILAGHVPSAVKDLFDQNDMTSTVLASNSQMEQMGRTSFEQNGKCVQQGIADFSDKETVERYGATLAKFFGEFQQAIEDKKPFISVPIFH